MTLSSYTTNFYVPVAINPPSKLTQGKKHWVLVAFVLAQCHETTPQRRSAKLLTGSRSSLKGSCFATPKLWYSRARIDLKGLMPCCKFVFKPRSREQSCATQTYDSVRPGEKPAARAGSMGHDGRSPLVQPEHELFPKAGEKAMVAMLRDGWSFLERSANQVDGPLASLHHDLLDHRISCGVL